MFCGPLHQRPSLILAATVVLISVVIFQRGGGRFRVGTLHKLAVNIARPFILNGCQNSVTMCTRGVTKSTSECNFLNNYNNDIPIA